MDQNRFSQMAKTQREKQNSKIRKVTTLRDCQPAFSIFNLNIHVVISDTNQSMNSDESNDAVR